MKKTLLIIAGSALATGLAIKAAPALSQVPADFAEVNVSIVRTADLDLSTSAGRRSLEQRLAVAAHEVCYGASDSDLKGRNAERACRVNVVATGKAKASALAGTGSHLTIRVAATR